MTTVQNSTTFASIESALAAIGQSHVLAFHSTLTPDQQRTLLAQAQDLPISELPKLITTYVTAKPSATLPSKLEPAKYYPFNHKSPTRPWDRLSALHAGEDLIRRGKVAAFVVAGGQGSRLGFEGPKGCYPAGCVTQKPLFAIFAENLLGAQDRYNVTIPWYVMTSPLNHAATVAFFEQHRFFGLHKDQVRFFPQGVMPSFDIATGKILLAAKGEIATNPDGHGGSIRALQVSGALADMKGRGIEHLSYFQVDNPLVNIIDPIFIGLHAAAPDSSGEMSSKMVQKAGPDEKVGVFCLADGRTEVIEYSDMPAEISRATNADGSLKFNAGSIAIHVISVEFIERLATDPRFALPFHRAEKKIPHIDLATGQLVSPSTNNGIKLERFIFDALALCRSSIVYETDRNEEFAPIKNASGADSPATSSMLQSARAAKWLAMNDVQIASNPDGSPNCTIELSPRTAAAPEHLKGKTLPARIEAGAKISL